MIIKAKPLNPFFFKCGAMIISWLFKRRFNKIIFRNIDIKPDHSYLLMCNHFSFLDGLIAYHICDKSLSKTGKMKSLYIMSLKKQMEKNKWLRYCGAFSVAPGTRSITESFDYAIEILSKPGNVLLFYPQGKLESSLVRHIQFQDGLKQIVPKVKGKCQLIWSSNLMDYFESTKPSLYYNLLDCGTSEMFDFEALKQQVNQHHQQSIAKNIRFTKEPIS